MLFCKKYGCVYFFIIWALLRSAYSYGDPYSVLGVLRTASKADIRKAYAKLVQKHRPDRGENRAKFEEIQAAYEALQDKPARPLFGEDNKPSTKTNNQSGKTDSNSANNANGKQRSTGSSVYLWISEFNVIERELLAGKHGDFYRAHPLTLFYRVIIGRFGWHFRDHRSGLNKFFSSEDHREAVLYLMNRLLPHLSVVQKSKLFYYDLPYLLYKSLIDEPQSDESLSFAVEVLHIMGDFGIHVQLWSLVDQAIDIDINAYGGEKNAAVIRPMLRKLIRARVRAYPDSNSYGYLGDPVKRKAQQYLYQSRWSRRFLSQCGQILEMFNID